MLELITVVVIIGIIGSLGLGFIISSVNGYQDNIARSQLMARGRQVLERITRELRVAVPGTVRVSANSLCIEWLPAVAGGIYMNELPDQNNGAAAISTIEVGPLNFTSITARYVVVGAFVDNEIYAVTPASVALYDSIDSSSIPNTISLTAPKQFLRNSIGRRLYVAAFPQQFCVANNQLSLHSNYTSAGNYPASFFSGSPPNVGVLLADGINLSGQTPFALSAGTEDRSAIIQLELPFSRNGESVVLQHQLMVRNVP